MPRPTPFIIAPDDKFLTQNPQLKTLARHLSTAYAERQVVTDDFLQGVGSALWQALGLTDELELSKAQAGQQALPIIIETADPAIHNLPWETLYHAELGFLGRAAGYTLSRRISSLHRVLPDTETGPLRVLLFTSLPDSLDEVGRLDVEAEQAAVQEALGGLEQAGWVCLEMPDDGQFQTFMDSLREFKPHLVYLSGHGEYKQDLLRGKAYGSFLFEGPLGEPLPIDEAQLADCFSQTEVQILVLSACQSGKQSSATLCNGLSQTLLQRGIPHVIGMRESILDAAGIQFAQAFFTAIAEKQSVDCALQQARAAIIHPLKGAVYRELTDPIKAGVSSGQWCLPMLLSHDIDHAVVDWRFEPRPLKQAAYNRTLGAVTLPERFIGRRRELRLWQNRIRQGQVKSLLITGAGGLGKTALAGKLVEGFKKQGYETYVYSARLENRCKGFIFDLELALEKDHAVRYDRGKPRCKDEAGRAALLLSLLMNQHDNRLALFFDNLEFVQDPHSLHLNDPVLEAWLAEAGKLRGSGLRLILTSRWKLPGWTNEEHYQLGKPVYGDFIALASRQNLPRAFLEDHQRLRQAYRVLNGNFRGLSFFAEAIKHLTLEQEQDFLEKLAAAEDDTQADMMLKEVISQRSTAERELLQRLLAFQSPVPFEGIKVLCLPDLSQPRELMETLLNVSLLEQFYNTEFKTTDYQLSALVRDWLQENGFGEPDAALLIKVAEFQLWLLENERGSFNQALVAHASLKQVGLQESSQKVVLNKIIAPLENAGLFQTLLDDWLPELAASENIEIRGNAFNLIGKQYYYLAQYDKAVEYYQQALAIQQEIGDRKTEGATLNNLGMVCCARGEYDSAIDYFKQASAIQQAIGDRQMEGTTLNNLGMVCYARGEYDPAIDYYKQGLAIQQEIGDLKTEGATLNNLGAACYARGEYDPAIDYYKQALAIQQEIGDRKTEGATLNNIGLVCYARGEYDPAIDYYKQALAIQQEIGDRKTEGTTLNNLGAVCYARGEYDSAIDYYKQALAIQQAIGDRQMEGTTLSNLGMVCYACGEYDPAIDYYKQGLAIQQEIGDRKTEGATLNNLGMVCCARGEYDSAIDYYKQALAIQQAIGDRQMEGTTLNNIGLVSYERGEYDSAIDYYKQALAIQQAIGDRQTEGTTLNNLGMVCYVRGEYDPAIDYYKQALAIQQEIGDRKTEATTLNNLGLVCYARGENDSAANYYSQSLAINKEIGDMAGICGALYNIGYIHQQNNDLPEAIRTWLQAFQIAKNIQLAQYLIYLEKLAEELNLSGGWDSLDRELGEGSVD